MPENDTTATAAPQALRAEMETLAGAYGGVRAERRESDLPGFDYFELFGWHADDADVEDPEQVDGEDVRTAGAWS